MTRLYYREASACVAMFDVTNFSTFTNCQKWKQDLDSKLKLQDGKQFSSPLDREKIVLNNCFHNEFDIAELFQSDLYPWAMTREEIDQFSKENGFTGWTETSVKENKNVNESMRVLVEKMMATTWLGDNDMSVSGHGDYINLKDGSTSNLGCC
ncbi:ras-related protein Rab-7L1 [Protobothrops mucrosquamatus]|uniref:ras-related protein Rab-7L1 n=1 Tax=Protobothrops mucrosquamatus TaxID=103944 RepID=UPI00077599C3|nr:ras-related protein Rab-7L1 [Protobothrops mucrosquamatus]